MRPASWIGSPRDGDILSSPRFEGREPIDSRRVGGMIDYGNGKSHTAIYYERVRLRVTCTSNGQKHVVLLDRR